MTADQALCNHCANSRPLTKEHVPPRSAGNAAPIRMTTAQSFENLGPTEFTTHDDGFCVGSLCEACNLRGSTEGTVAAYTKLRDFVLGRASREATDNNVDILRDLDGLEIDLPYDLMPSRFARQLVSMLVSVQTNPEALPDIDRLRAIAMLEKPERAANRLGRWKLGLGVTNQNYGWTRFPVSEVRLATTNLWLPEKSRSTTHSIVLMVLTPFFVTLTNGPMALGLDVSDWVDMHHHQRIKRTELTVLLPNAWSTCPQLLQEFGFTRPPPNSNG